MVVVNIGLFLFIKKRYNDQLKELKMNKQYYESLYEQNLDLILTLDLEGNILSANKVVEYYGYKEKDLLHHSFVPYVVPNQLEHTLEHFRKAVEGVGTSFNTTILSKSGEVFGLSVKNIPIYAHNKIVGVYAILKDITELKNTQGALEDAKMLYQNLAEDSPVGIYIIDQRKYEYVNIKMSEMLGYSMEELIGKDVMNFVFPEDHELVAENIRKRLRDNATKIHYQYRAMKKDKSIIYMEVHGTRTIYKGKPVVLGTVIDVTASKMAQQKIEYMAYHDSLTGLSNRFHFYRQLERALEQESTKNIAVLYLDLDRFQTINESMGHVVGDRLLQDVSNRLKKCIGDQGNLARNGGDEFLVSLLNMNHKEISKVAQDILDCFTKPFQIDHYEIYTTPSIGISFYPENGSDVETLMKKADIAMYQAKRNGTNRYDFYPLKQIELTNEKFEIEMNLRKAVDRQEFKLLYQPKLDLMTGKMVGVEALIRWHHPEKGMISPADFIPIAEENGLIVPIGEWVLRTACVQNKAWQDRGLPPMVMAVNLSVRHLYQPNLVEMIEKVLLETNLAPEYLEIEITESMLMDTEQGLKILRSLKDLGVQLSLDDFGTGYSSLNYLKDYPLDKLKIDQSFIKNCTTDDHYATIVKTIIAMAHELKLQVVAEGVELKEHLVFLQRNACNEAQGYLFSKPIPPDELVERFNEIEKMISKNGIPEHLSDQRWSEEALHMARQDLVNTVRQHQGVIFKFIKKDGRFIHTLCDGMLMEKMNVMPEQIMGKGLQAFLSEQDAKVKSRYYERAWNGEENVTYEGKINGMDYLASLKPVYRGGRIVEVIGSCIDITERKQVEEELKVSARKYRYITENMLDLVSVWDVTGRLIYASPSHEKTLGFPWNDYEGKLLSELSHPDDFTRMQDLFTHISSTKKPRTIEFKVNHANGDLIYVEAQCTPVINENEEVKHLVFVGRA
ncbi:EAL domain-containing protein [Niallia sp. Krafla_26]|uniref:EAL domain-containing protein n=1 Tax=Niallia sp. Krafla_26 TaxID=3064703 RepID=UPI003D177609